MSSLNIILNGKNITGNSGESILELAKRNGIEIPTLCNDPRLEPYSSCYVCVVEALKHAGWKLGLKPNLIWMDAEKLDYDYSKLDGIIIPQGWGKRGVEGKINAIKYARENNIPYLGLCFGMQMAVIEFARNVLGLKNANTEEADPNTKYPVIHTMDYQKELIKNHEYGGTIRLGSYDCKLKKGTLLSKVYGRQSTVSERHRHRYEFNNKFKSQFEKTGMVISGTSPDGKLVEAIELPNHKFFVGTQFHPEYKSRPLSPHPLFTGFVQAALKLRAPVETGKTKVKTNGKHKIDWNIL